MKKIGMPPLKAPKAKMPGVKGNPKMGAKAPPPTMGKNVPGMPMMKKGGKVPCGY